MRHRTPPSPRPSSARPLSSRLLPACFAAACLSAMLMAGCSSVSTRPAGHGANAGPHTPVRNDRADTLSFPPGEGDGYRPPAQMAVLLPLSGSLASAGASVRDGFLAAYYGESRRRPVVKFYDTHGTVAGAQAAGAQALAEGAQMLVGPLGRDEANAFSVPAGSRVPVVVLNHVARATAGQTSFALLPDDEGIDAAERLLNRGQEQVLVFAARSDSAQRAAAAFRHALAAGGGRVVGDIAISGDTPDLGPQLAALQSGPTPAKAVFLALEAGQARAVVAQLKVSAAASLPRIGTSLILNGANARSDAELDGTEYPELPWLLGQASGLPDAAGIKLSSARGGANRLFAFGADAWKLAAYFERLYNDPSFSIQGATGGLQIDVAGPVRRTPSWAVLSGGHGRAR
jgi:outer membrane PBP1 activator LpoA protein